MEVTEQEIKDCLWRAFKKDGGADFIHIDGHALRSQFLRTVTLSAERKGWLDLGKLIEEEQDSYYHARLTKLGKNMLEMHVPVER